MTDPFTVWQSVLPNRIGISIEEVRVRRERFLTEGLHWQKRGGRIVLTHEAERLLVESLSVPAPANAAAPPAAVPDQEAAVQPPQKSARLIVSRSAPQIRNQRIVEAHWEHDDAVLLLWVRDNTKFRVGHVIPAEAVELRQPGQYNYVAGRPPR